MHASKKQKFLSGGEKTLNNTGYMVGNLDPYSLEFIGFAKESSGTAADIGACFGIATLAALEAGVKQIIAIDNEPRHLEILRQRADPKHLDRLTCLVGALPENILLENNSLSAILCSRTLHLLHGNEINISLKQMYNWLEPDGRLYLINDSPYVNEHFLSIYEKNKKEGVRWPGHIPNIKDYLTPEFAKISPEYITLMDIDTTTNACKEHGFEIIKAEFIDRPDYPPSLQGKGKENVAIVVAKR
jgi:ubiquinone/menaquinone biosynthesis C-methylase UbiE